MLGTATAPPVQEQLAQNNNQEGVEARYNDPLNGVRHGDTSSVSGGLTEIYPVPPHAFVPPALINYRVKFNDGKVFLVKANKIYAEDSNDLSFQVIDDNRNLTVSAIFHRSDISFFYDIDKVKEEECTPVAERRVK